MAVTFEVQPDRQSHLYDGIYTSQEVSSYLLATMPAKQRPPTSRRIVGWIRHGLVATRWKHAPGREVVLTFEDLVTCQAITLLQEAGFGPATIREVERALATRSGTRNLFAHRDFWHSDPGTFGRAHGQRVLSADGERVAREFITTWLKRLSERLDFSEATGRAASWHPADRISLRPSVQFGQPCIDGTRIPAGTIWSYVHAGDSPQFIAASFGLRIEDVERAVEWEERRRAALEAPTAVPA
jgi:uncharacterized protein (DUF433 family)